VFGFSFWEIAIIVGIALIVLGPKKLPELARSLGKGIREFRRATDDFKSSVEAGMYEEEKRKKLAETAEVVPAEPVADQQAAAKAEAAAAEAVAKHAKSES
jgi:TatA/E family protein of Tat protein translocase